MSVVVLTAFALPDALLQLLPGGRPDVAGRVALRRRDRCDREHTRHDDEDLHDDDGDVDDDLQHTAKQALGQSSPAIATSTT